MSVAVLDVEESPVVLLTPVSAPTVRGALAATDWLERALDALEHERTWQQTKQIHDAATAAERYFRQQRLGKGIIRQAKIITLVALRRLGGFLTATPRASGGQPYHGATGTQCVPVATLADLKIDKNTSSWAQQLHDLPDDFFEAICNGDISVRRALVEYKRLVALGNGTFWAVPKPLDPHAYELRVGSCATVLGSGVRPTAVVTTLPAEPENIDVCSELASSCRAAGVSFVAVRIRPSLLEHALPRLTAHLTYRWATAWEGDYPARSFGNWMWLMFCDDVAFARGRRDRRILDIDTMEGVFINRFTVPGQLVCDPSAAAKTCIAALELGRHFLGSHADVNVVAAVRRQIEREVAYWNIGWSSPASTSTDQPRA
jgi:hypothetical protein